MEAINMATMREAVKYARAVLASHKTDMPYGTWGEIDEAIRKCDSALALPRRQCDVGSAEDQEKRFRECCGCRCMTKCKVYEKGIALGIVNKNNYYKVGCRFVWAQMPYEEGGAE